MTAKQKTARKLPQRQICPYLGLNDDLDTHMTFTSPLNYCQRGKVPAPVSLEHQGGYCLDANHKTCPVYIQGGGKSFPRELRGRGVKSSDYVYPVIKRRSWLPWIFLLGLIILFGAGFWLMRGNLDSLAGSISTPFSLPLASDTPIAASATPLALPLTSASVTPDPVHTLTVTPFPTLTLTPATSPPTEVSLRSLEMPIGPVQKYVIHQVSGGENLTGLATRYQTSIDAIMTVNIMLKVPIREGSVVIMPLEIANPVGLPAFEPYQVEADGILAEALAAELGTDPALMKYFNIYEDGERLRKGDWILVPRVRPEAP